VPEAPSPTTAPERQTCLARILSLYDRGLAVRSREGPSEQKRSMGAMAQLDWDFVRLSLPNVQRSDRQCEKKPTSPYGSPPQDTKQMIESVRAEGGPTTSHNPNAITPTQSLRTEPTQRSRAKRTAATWSTPNPHSQHSSNHDAELSEARRRTTRTCRRPLRSGWPIPVSGDVLGISARTNCRNRTKIQSDAGSRPASPSRH